MLPRKIDKDAPASERKRWRIIRLDKHEDIPGEILSADCDAGICTMRRLSDSEVSDLAFGPNGIAIVGRA